MLHIWIQHIFKPEFVWIWLNMCAGHGSGFIARHFANYAEQKTFSHRIEILKANTAPRACASGNERYWPPRDRTHTDIYTSFIICMYTVYSIQYTVYNIHMCHIYYIKDIYIHYMYTYHLCMCEGAYVSVNVHAHVSVNGIYVMWCDVM